MSNSYFRFRQFTVQQDRCIMKVCTDSCILGAWTAARLNTAGRVMDIGTGTGLLSLMLAQKNLSVIDAVELDPDAYTQASENFASSPWSDRIHPVSQDVRHYPFRHTHDFVITNPPFFEDDLRSRSSGKNRAKHAETLDLRELMDIIHRILSADGSFSILLPFHRSGYFENLAAEKGCFLREKMLVRQSPAHPHFRSVSLFSLKEAFPLPAEELTIRDELGRETPELLQLLGDYYIR